ncbi:hypothetical protein BS50DRAFT_634840 [Corynespora cassiicola Philippines]|uniref:Uncharacterized protein n=1 Tax=Corynespora cassiicola Philippines TaxID=1448308 RepID=A0A2T2NQ26_CORCC|nr:hypothetical protein BS50DRAFT_634840 [Corynespora cassiicola Philippines]
MTSKVLQQEIIFEGLADSICNPANFPCICDELTRLNIGFLVDGSCTLEETARKKNPPKTRPSTSPSARPTSKMIFTSLDFSVHNPSHSTPTPMPVSSPRPPKKPIFPILVSPIIIPLLTAHAISNANFTSREFAAYLSFGSNTIGHTLNTDANQKHTEYDDFVRTLCSTIRPIAPSVPSIPQNISNTTSTPALPPIPLFTGTGLPTNRTNGTVGPVGPFPNVTDSATVLPPPAVTSVVVIQTTDAQGNPTLLTTAVAPVAPPTAAAPGEPEFTGAAARGAEVPEFGGVRMGFVAGGVGLFALLFAGM